MKKINDNGILKKIPWALIAIIAVTVTFIVIAVIAQGKSTQSTDAYIFDVALDGEYRIADGDWQPLSNAKHISSTDKTVELKGVFKYYDSQTGEEICAAENGTVISFYLDHLKATVKDSKGNVWVSDSENEQIGKSSCSQMWLEYIFEGDTGDEVHITLENPHSFGNGKAIDKFLSNIRIYNVENHKSLFYNVGALEITVTILLLVFLFIMLATALFATLLRTKYTQEIWLASLLVLFGEIYFIFSWDKLSIWINWYTLNTIVLGASMMLYIIAIHAILTKFFDEKLKTTITCVTVALGASSLASTVIPLFASVKFYDFYLYWTVFASILSLITVACIITVLLRQRKKNITTKLRKKKYIYISAIVILSSFIIDTIFSVIGIYQGSILSKLIFLVIVLVSVIVIGRVVPRNIRTMLDAKNIEAEKQAMELKLQESRISIMLSQIQPHFLYNTLNSIYQLCETNPMRARSMVNSFAEYLRNNLSSLDEPGLISFKTELAHINTYLDIEKIRFEDTLEINYDIQCVDFLLPVLTVQPIVENAVKHGTSKKRGGGTVTISTKESDEYYIITVSDTGCGFDTTQKKNDGKRHIGIENVRQRLLNMCGGVLTIESEVGVGTIATIKIPKEVKI